MTDMEKKLAARAEIISRFQELMDKNNGEQFADASWAFAVDVEGQEVWVELNFKAKAFKDTKKSKAFDPFVAAEDWKADKEERAQKKLEREAKKNKNKKVEEEDEE